MRFFIGCVLCLLMAACQTPRGKPWSVTHHTETRTISMLQAQKSTGDVYEKLRHAIQILQDIGPLYADITYAAKSRGGESLVDVKTFLINNGIAEDRIKTNQDGAIFPGDEMKKRRKIAVSVTLKTYRLNRLKCPGFGDTMDSNQGVEGERNFNCSITANDVAMIANPRAYIEGRSLRGGDGIYHSRVVGQYQQGKTKELKIEKVTSANAG